MRLAAVLCVIALGAARADELGALHVEVTGSAPAQAAFRRGLLALHSFWYEQAKDDFDEAARLDPRMTLAHWGAAQTYVNPVWNSENLAGCREELGKIDRAAPVNALERALVDSTRVLCGEGDKPARWTRYAEALHAARLQQPDSEELVAFEALALLGLDNVAETDRLRRRMQAGALALELFARNPDHPGAAHYVIHAFDDPDHAILALPAARRYAQIAPAAYHARHMPSHIFVQLGMWEEAAASNESSWAASVEQATAHHRDESWYDFHSLEWLVDIRLELGQKRAANATLQRGFEALKRSKDPELMPLVLSRIGADYMAQTKSWSRADELLAPLRQAKAAIEHSQRRASEPACAGHREAKLAEVSLDADFLRALEHAEAAVGLHDAKTAHARLDEARAALPKMTKKDADDWAGAVKSMDAEIAALEGHADLAEKIWRALLADGKPADPSPSGPLGRETVRERLGALLLAQKKPLEALVLYRQQLDRSPRRSTSLLGAARSARAANDPSVKTYYRTLADLWKNADDSPELREVRAHAN
jgi:tetratricopeptide (TPR) repeat protein